MPNDAIQPTPFGFNQADVDLLREVMADEVWITKHQAEPYESRIANLASRIAALLPPESAK
jgi:hypothetical protein